MDFQRNQEIARRGTARLVFFLALGTLAIVITLGVLASAWFYVKVSPQAAFIVFLVTTPITLVFVGLSAIIKNARVRHGGGKYLAASLGGWPVQPYTKDVGEKRLINIVEEIAVAAGAPVPTAFVLRDEPGINAFAAGWTPDSSAIGVTAGALRHLTRSELQAVVAHEFSHITNGDTQVKTRVLGWVYGIASITVFGKTFLRKATHGAGRIAGLHGVVVAAIIGVALVIVGASGTWFARLGQAAISREREHLADASAVEFTRDPDSLAGALLKIGALGSANSLFTPHAEEAAHLFFETPFSRSHATHPPLKQRIRELLPSWDSRWPSLASVKQSVNEGHDISVDGFALPEIPGLPTMVAKAAQTSIPGVDATPLGPILGTAFIAEVASNGGGQAEPKPALSPSTGFEKPKLGAPTQTHIEYAQTLLARIPQETKDYLHTNNGAVAAIVGLLVSRDGALRPGELHRASEVSGFEPEYLDQASNVISSLDRPLQLPAIEIALSAFRDTPADVQRELVTVIRNFTTSSPDTDLFRWMLRRVVLRHLVDANDHEPPSSEHGLAALRPEAGIVYSVVASFNSSGEQAIEDAFFAAHRGAKLPRPSQIPVGASLGVDNLDAALDRLSEMSDKNRIAFVEGAIAAVLTDAHTSADEAELLRAIADAVRVPMPLILPLEMPTQDATRFAA